MALAAGEKAILQVVMAAHAGITTDEFAKVVQDLTKTARHPKTERAYIEMVYQLMLELLAFLRQNGFKAFIVSGGGIEFMRAWAEGVYGIPQSRRLAARYPRGSRCGRWGRPCCASRRPTSSTTGWASRWESIGTSAGGPSSHSATLT